MMRRPRTVRRSKKNAAEREDGRGAGGRASGQYSDRRRDFLVSLGARRLDGAAGANEPSDASERTGEERRGARKVPTRDRSSSPRPR